MNRYIKIENEQYGNVFPDDSAPIEIRATVDGDVVSIPIDPDNRHYAEAMRQVAAGTLTIADAE